MNSKFLIIFAILSVVSGIYGDDQTTISCLSLHQTDSATDASTMCTGSICYFVNFTMTTPVGDTSNKVTWESQYGCGDQPIYNYGGTNFSFSMGRCDDEDLSFPTYTLHVHSRFCNNRDNCTDTCSSNRPQVFLAALFLILISKIIFF